MKLAINLGWDSTFILTEKQLAQLMPILEQCHPVTLRYVEGLGSCYEYRELKPELRVLGDKDKVFEHEELETIKQQLEKEKANDA